MAEAITIKNDDQAYLNWREKYPNGYVLNVYKSGKWVTLHRADCRRLNAQRQFSKGTYTAKLSFKICGLTKDSVSEEAGRQNVEYYSECSCLSKRH